MSALCWKSDIKELALASCRMRWTSASASRVPCQNSIGISTHHGRQSKAGRALAFLLHTGAARIDLVSLGRQHLREGRLVFRRRKSGIAVEIPILPPLQQAIDDTPKTQLTFIVTDFGKPFTPAGFGNKMRRWCDEAGLPHCSAHGLRKTGATIAADNGATPHQLMAMFGWNTLKQAEHYTRGVDRKRLANEGMRLISLDQSANETVPPLTADASSGTKIRKKP
jgi:integrase